MAQKRSTSNLWFCKISIKPPRGGGGGGNGYSWEFLVGACRPVLQILTPIQTKICHFLHPFSDAASKIRTRFQTCHIFLKSHFEFVYILELKRQIHIFMLYRTWKIIPDSRPKWAECVARNFTRNCTPGWS